VTQTARGQALAGKAVSWYAGLPVRHREIAQDTGLALALAVLNLLTLLPYESNLHPLWPALLLVSGQCLPLALRRVWPLPVAIVVGVLRDLYDGLGYGFAPLPLAPGRGVAVGRPDRGNGPAGDDGAAPPAGGAPLQFIRSKSFV
jgi:hypothetical protein